MRRCVPGSDGLSRWLARRVGTPPFTATEPLRNVPPLAVGLERHARTSEELVVACEPVNEVDAICGADRTGTIEAVPEVGGWRAVAHGFVAEGHCGISALADVVDT